MLESLEKLQCRVLSGGEESELGSDLADEIQAEVDEKYIPRDEVERCYLPRPLFEDGEPVQVGDEVADGMGVFTVERICYGPATYYLEGDNHILRLTMDTRVSRPPEPDTQEKIDHDSGLTPQCYCRVYGLDAIDDGCLLEGRKVDDREAQLRMTRHLLARQRKSDGVE